MFYDLDTFGHINGYLHDNWTVMSHVDLLQDKTLAKELKQIQYDNWRRHNFSVLKQKWSKLSANLDFESYCKIAYKKSCGD